MNKRQYRRSNAAKRKVIARGIAVCCGACHKTDQVNPKVWHKGKARCTFCGGSLERVNKPGTFSEVPDLDQRRKVPRKLGCPARRSE